jgi:predicted alpha-1,6-mannanase (GH76 family)
MRTCTLHGLVLATVLCCQATAQQNTPPADRVRVAMDALMRHYDPARGLWSTEGWWNAANSTTVLGEAAALDPTADDRRILETTFVKAQTSRLDGQPAHPGFINKFYDDEGWWALAWIQAYDATQQPQYLQMAETIFTDMTTGWDSTCGGGLWWTKDRTYKNAIPNELFLSVAAHLANRTQGKPRASYLDWATREWTWFAHSGMFNKDDLVNDGLTSSCQNNGRNPWSYNQGVVLGGLVELSRASGNPSAIATANAIAHAAISKLEDANGVLHDPGEPHCSGDTVQFKGIFIRNLVTLDRASPHEEYDHFVATNAAAVWDSARLAQQGFSCRWSGPAEDRGAGATTSAMEPLLGVLQLNQAAAK